MSIYTPGPWVAVEANERTPLPAGVALAVQKASAPWDRTGTICEMIGQGEGKYEPEVTSANARLIAAAPELLTALKKAMPGFIELHAQDIGCPDCLNDEYIAQEPERCPAVQQIEAAIAKAEGK